MAPVDEATFDGDDFSNNLFTDLAPLLTLFGEQVTKQFLSLSLSWADNVLLAMGPLGIMTVVVSAIRVGGGPLLRALVGRAREEKALVEQELLSSTSEEICEMWNGTAIVRTKGKPASPMKTLVITADGRVLSLPQLKQDEDKDDRLYDIKGAKRATGPETGFSQGLIPWEAVVVNAPPNLTLNLQNTSAQTSEIWAFALLGVVLQAVALVVPALATYRWRLDEDGKKDARSYGYPCYLIGSVLLIAGILGCGHVIEGATREITFKCRKEHRNNVAVVRLQEACTVGDQYFPRVALFNSFDNPDISVSVWNIKNLKSHSHLATLSTGLAIPGFVIQFVGLRALHWSASVIQLGITFVMTAVRAWVRRGITRKPPHFELTAFQDVTPEATAAWLVWGLSTMSGKSQTALDWNQEWEKYVDEGPMIRWELLTGAFWGTWWNKYGKQKTLEKPLTTSFTDSPLEGEKAVGLEPLREWSRRVRAFHDVAALYPDVVLPEIIQNSEAIEIAIRGVITAISVSDQYTNEASWQRPSPLFYWGPAGSRKPDLRTFCWEIDIIRGVRRGMTDERDTFYSIQPISITLAGESLKDTFRSLFFCWRYSLALERLEDYSALRDNQPRRFARIVGVSPPHTDCPTKVLGQWINRPLQGHQCPNGQARVKGTAERNLFKTVNDPYFGMYLSSLSLPLPSLSAPPDLEDAQPKTDEMPVDTDLVVVDSHDTTHLEQFSRELFSLFMLALAGQMKQVPGKTIKTEDRPWVNTFFDSLAAEAVKAKVAQDLDDALVLIIPAFAKYNLLPREYSDEEEGAATGHQGNGMQEGKVEEQKEAKQK